MAGIATREATPSRHTRHCTPAVTTRSLLHARGMALGRAQSRRLQQTSFKGALLGVDLYTSVYKRGEGRTWKNLGSGEGPVQRGGALQ